MEPVSQKNKKARLTIADWISVYRISMSPVLLLALLAELRIVFVILLFLSLGSDMLDGFIARRLNCCTLRGARLDSIGDALTFVVAAFGIFHFEKEFFLGHVQIILWAIVPYAMQILFAIVRYGKPTSYHTYLAKIAALLQGCFILLLLSGILMYWLFYATVIVTILEIAEEFILLFMVGGSATNVKGLYWVLKKSREKLTGFDKSHARK